MEPFPNIARERLARQRPDSEHPTADVLAAFLERSLAPQEREDVLAHLARCADCREAVALASPEAETGVVPTQLQQRAWHEWWVFRVGGLAAALTVIVVAAALFLPHGRQAKEASAPAQPGSPASAAPIEQTSTSEQEPAAAPPAAQRDHLQDNENSRRASRERAAIPPATKTKVPPPESPAPETRGEKKSFLKGVPGGVRGEVGNAGKRPDGTIWDGFSGTPAADKQTARSATSPQHDTLKASVSPPVAPAPPPSPAVTAQQSESLGQLQATDQPASSAAQAASATAGRASERLPSKDAPATVPVAKPAPQAATAEVAPENALKPAPSATHSLKVDRALRTQSVARVPATSSLRWTISAEGAVQRSTDSGRHWQQVAIAESQRFRTIAFAGSTVWVGGSALYRSLDSGDHWERVNLVDGDHSMEGEVTRIDLPSSTRVEVVTATGQRWISSDNGASWHSQ